MGTLTNRIKKAFRVKIKVFPCPICGAQCNAKEYDKGAKAELHHPLPWCDGLTRGTLLSAYVAICKPSHVYPELDMPKAWKE